MLIPSTMINTISNVFYDKTINLMDNNVTVDAEGGVNYKGLNIVNTFKGNVSFSNCEKIQKEYGIDYSIDISITTNINCPININDIISYNDIVYNVKDVFKFDSHYLIVAVKWLQ